MPAVLPRPVVGPANEGWLLCIHPALAVPCMPELWAGGLLRNSRFCCSRPVLLANARCLLVAAVAGRCGLGLREAQQLDDGKGDSTAHKGPH